jgi:hypothetical protein
VDPKYVAAIKAGIIGAVILAVLALINNVIDFINIRGLGFLPCCLFIVEIVLLLGVGALAVNMAPGLIKKLEEALVSGAIAGAITLILAGIVGIILGFLFAMLKATTYDLTRPIQGMPELPHWGLFAGICAVCCLPIVLVIVGVIGAIVGAIGAAIYYETSYKK